jgi:hypothetical protein
MDLLDWIAASDRITLLSAHDEETVRRKLLHHRPHGFLTDFNATTVVAEQTGTSILLSRRSSFWGRVGIRCVARIAPCQHGSRIEARLWHSPVLTIWFCCSYGVAALAVLVSIVGAIRERDPAVIMGGGLMGVFWCIVTGVMNALVRVLRTKREIDPLMEVLRSVANEVPAKPSPTLPVPAGTEQKP